MRVVNGLLLGLIVSAFVFVANLALVRIIKILMRKFKIMEKLGLEKGSEME
jgi:hypothetical protein